MAENYTGAKFSTIFRRGDAKYDDTADELLRWCHKFAAYELAPASGDGFAGNLSARIGNDFLITATGANLAEATGDQLALVHDVDLLYTLVVASGITKPSSETFMHSEIYRARPDVKAIFHGHSQWMLDHTAKMGWPETPAELPYGTTRLATSVAETLQSANFMVIRNHGFIAVGPTMAVAGDLTLDMLAFTR